MTLKKNVLKIILSRDSLSLEMAKNSDMFEGISTQGNEKQWDGIIKSRSADQMLCGEMTHQRFLGTV